MAKSIKPAVLLSAILIPFLAGAAGVTALRTEHMDAPIGVESPNPRFSWRLDDPRDGAYQASWRIVVHSGSEVVWDSGTVRDGAVLATYAGVPLKPFTEYSWTVECEDMDGRRSEATSSFETGMMSRDMWRGNWISDGNDIDLKPAPRFRCEFPVHGAVVSARAYIACAGLYTLEINGAKVGDRVLDPAFTRFDRRILYTTFDVTDFLDAGANAVGVELGNGWYNHQAKATWDFDKAPWRARPAFCMDIRICYADGSVETVSTGHGWKTSTDGPVTYDNIYTGERHDARRNQAGWSRPGYDDSMWNGVILRSCPAPVVSAQSMMPVREGAEIRAVNISRIRPTRLVYDFGVNMSGNARLRIKGPAGTTVTLKYAERLGTDGQADQSNIDVYYFGNGKTEPFQTDVFTLSGGEDEFCARYSYKGFRYVEVELGSPVEMETDNLVAVPVHSDVPSAGDISSSAGILEAIHDAACRAYISNLMGYPTDCPQREKNGWTGDAHIAIETGLYNYDGFTVYEKWLADHRDEQQPNGVLPDIIPTGGWGYHAPSANGNGLDWTSTIALIPWQLYLFYGDDKPLRDCYDAMRRYVDYALTMCDGDGLCNWGRGDWVPVTTRSDKTLVCSCFLFKDLDILAKAAVMFGKTDDAERYSALAKKVRDAINARFLDAGTGIYAGGMQTDQSLPLVSGVVPDASRALVAAALASRVAADNYHVNAGVHGTKAVLTALSDNGYGELAYRMASATDYPSWGWWLANGRTTLVENWRLDAARDISDNHIMFGDVDAWFYRSIGGINPDPSEPGFKHILLRPAFPKGLEQFECAYESPYGTIRSGWVCKGRRTEYTAVIPCGSTATLSLPDGSVRELGSGVHTEIVRVH